MNDYRKTFWIMLLLSLVSLITTVILFHVYWQSNKIPSDTLWWIMSLLGFVEIIGCIGSTSLVIADFFNGFHKQKLKKWPMILLNVIPFAVWFFVPGAVLFAMAMFLMIHGSAVILYYREYVHFLPYLSNAFFLLSYAVTFVAVERPWAKMLELLSAK